MQNSESFVQQGEGTGAAIQLKPFDSSEIFKAYDYQPKKPLLDSFGKNLNYDGSKVYPEDIPRVRSAYDKVNDMQIRLMAEASRNKRDITPEQQAELAKAKMDFQDLLSVAQQNYIIGKDIEKDMAVNKYDYNPEDKAKLDEWKNTPPLERGLRPDITKNLDVNIDEIFGKMGDSGKATSYTTTDENGASQTHSKLEYDDAIATRNFNEVVTPFLLSGTRDANKAIAALRKDIEKVASAANLDYNALTPEQQATIMLDVAEDRYKAIQRANVKGRSVDRVKEAPLKDKDKDGTGKTNTKNDFGVISTMSYANYTPEGKRIPVRSGIEGGSPKLVRTASIPIAGRVGNDKFAQTNKEIKLFDFGKPFVGTLDKISIYGKPKSKDWEDGFWAVMSGKDDVGDEVVKEIFIDKTNKEIIEKEYEIKIQDLFDKHDWKGAAEALTAPHPSEGKDWDRLSATQKVARVKAWEEEYGPSKNVATPSKPTPAKKTEVDPDEEFKRK